MYIYLALCLLLHYSFSDLELIHIFIFCVVGYSSCVQALCNSLFCLYIWQLWKRVSHAWFDTRYVLNLFIVYSKPCTISSLYTEKEGCQMSLLWEKLCLWAWKNSKKKLTLDTCNVIFISIAYLFRRWWTWQSRKELQCSPNLVNYPQKKITKSQLWYFHTLVFDIGLEETDVHHGGGPLDFVRMQFSFSWAWPSCSNWVSHVFVFWMI